MLAVSRYRRTLPLLYVLLALSTVVDARIRQNDGPVAGFIPKKWPAIVTIVLYSLSAAVHWYYYYKWGKRYMLTLTIGMSCMVLGFILRIVYSNSPNSLGLYIITTLFVLLSPCAFLATDYIILHHMSLTLDPVSARDTLFLSPSKIVRLFVSSDIATFLLQAAGGGISVQKSSANVGKDIALIGLILQLLSFSSFTCLLLYFGWKVDTKYSSVWHPNGGKNMRTLFIVTCFTCIGILIRSVFRIIEYAGGYRGVVATHEAYFYPLDPLPLWLSMSMYCFFWPPTYIREFDGSVGKEQASNDLSEFEMANTDSK